MAGRLDITGQVFGRLTAVRPTEMREYRNNVVWEFVCVCGVHKYATVAMVRSGNTQSCGCLRQEALAGYRKEARARALVRRRRIARGFGKGNVLAMLERVGL